MKPALCGGVVEATGTVWVCQESIASVVYEPEWP